LNDPNPPTLAGAKYYVHRAVLQHYMSGRIRRHRSAKGNGRVHGDEIPANLTTEEQSSLHCINTATEHT
jgi:DNA topoisomerase IB